MNKKETDRERMDRERNERNGICAAILLAFNKQMKYDYCIPDAHHIIKRLDKFISPRYDTSKLLDIPESLKERMVKVIHGEYDSYSALEYYMSSQNNDRLRGEWFFGWGTLFTWRAGERKKAVIDMKKLLTKAEFSEIEKVWKVLKIQNLNYNKTNTFWND